MTADNGTNGPRPSHGQPAPWERAPQPRREPPPFGRPTGPPMGGPPRPSPPGQGPSGQPMPPRQPGPQGPSGPPGPTQPLPPGGGRNPGAPGGPAGPGGQRGPSGPGGPGGQRGPVVNQPRNAPGNPPAAAPPQQYQRPPAPRQQPIERPRYDAGPNSGSSLTRTRAPQEDLDTGQRLAYSEVTDDDPLLSGSPLTDSPPRRTSSARSRSSSTRPRGVATGPAPQTNRLAIIALVLSFLGITWLPGVICGHVARVQIAKNRQTGDAYAVAALWIGYFYLAFMVTAIIVFMLVS